MDASLLDVALAALSVLLEPERNIRLPQFPCEEEALSRKIAPSGP